MLFYVKKFMEKKISLYLKHYKVKDITRLYKILVLYHGEDMENFLENMCV